MIGREHVRHVPVVLTFLALLTACGSKRPVYDANRARHFALLPVCRQDPSPCERACEQNDSVACYVLETREVAKAIEERERAANAPVVDVAPLRLPPRPRRPVLALLPETADAEAALKKAAAQSEEHVKIAGQLFWLLTDIALYGDFGDWQPPRRARLIRAAAKRAVEVFWNEGGKDGPKGEREAYTLGLLYEVLAANEDAEKLYRAVVANADAKSKLVPFAHLGIGIVLDANGNHEAAKTAYMSCLSIPPWENPVWDEARKRAGLPDGYETPAIVERRRKAAEDEAERRKAAEAEAAERPVRNAFGSVTYSIDDIAKMRFKVRFGRKTFPPTAANIRGLARMEADANRKVRDDYCPARQEFVDQYGVAEFARRAKDYCEESPPRSGGYGEDQPLTADCNAIVGTACTAGKR